jgi:hypothetical protein
MAPARNTHTRCAIMDRGINVIAAKKANRRPGGVLVEFSLIAVILFLILAATFDFGRSVYSAQVIQQAADYVARELSVTPLPPNFDLNLDDKNVNQALLAAGVYSEDFLVIDVTSQPKDQFLLDYLDARKIPSANRLLVPLMIIMDNAQNQLVPPGARWLVYPGALVPSPTGTAETGFTVRIPVVQYPSEGVEVIADQAKWLRVMEVDREAFKLSSPQRGQVSVRVNFPFQAAALSGSSAGDNGPTTPQGAYIAVPGDEELQPGQVGGPYSGSRGLGQQAAFTKTVRPFRRVISAQAVYRREVLNPANPLGVLP